MYLTDIGGLRMATNYTFQVIPLDPGTEESQPSKISLQTKGCKDNHLNRLNRRELLFNLHYTYFKQKRYPSCVYVYSPEAM